MRRPSSHGMLARRACAPCIIAVFFRGLPLASASRPQQGGGHGEPDDDEYDSFGWGDSERGDQGDEMDYLFEYVTEESAPGNKPIVSCQDPARYQAECPSWQHLCPNNGKPQPSMFDDFMLEWCPKTCGSCGKDKIANADLGTDPLGGAKPGDEGGTMCKPEMVSRRRVAGNQCACRRRSGNKGLQPGWMCKGESIVWEGYSTDENAEKPVFCCCKRGECTDEALRRGDGVQQYNLREMNGTWCCKYKFGDRDSGLCPYLSGYASREALGVCKHPHVEASINACSERLNRWLADMKWYKLVTGWELDEETYASYTPCLVPEGHHVGSYMLASWNTLAHVTMENPLRGFIVTRPECSGLRARDLTRSMEIAYRAQCPWGMPQRAYKPDMNSEGTCTYDPLDRRINQQESSMCVEGHRCACPVFSQTDNVVRSAWSAYRTYAVGSMLIRSARSAALYAPMAATYFTGLGFIEQIGARVSDYLAQYVWPLTVGIGAMSLVTFGSSYVWAWAEHTCGNNVGCYPMDCVPELDGCRIRPPDDFNDERNPFWFLPPPTYKCAYKMTGCTLRPCTQRDLWNQTVGVRPTRSPLHKGKTQVYNCQPILAKDMSSSQRSALAEATFELREEYRTKELLYQRMRKLLEEVCPWSRPTKDNVLRCRDMTSCVATKAEQACCDRHGGILQCPENFPLVCEDGYCGDDGDLCEGRGGVKPCPAMDDCPWLFPNLHRGKYECNDGSYEEYRPSSRWCPCQKGRGVKRCPYDRPVMCSETKPNSVCVYTQCKKDCRTAGGPRVCPIFANETFTAKKEIAQAGQELA